MQDAISLFKNRLFMFSFGLGLASTVAVFQPNTNIKEVGKFALGFSVAGVALGEFLTGKAISEANRLTQKSDDVLKSQKAEISTLTKNFDVLKNSLKTATANTQRLEQELDKGQAIVSQKTQDLVTASQEITELKIKLTEVGKFSKTEAYQIVRKTYVRAVKKLEGLLDGLVRNYPAVKEDLDPIYLEVDSFQSRYLQRLTEYETCESFAELLDIGMELQERIIDKCVELKVKAQTIIIRHLETLCSESIPYVDYETHIKDLTARAGETIKQNQQAIALEWVAANHQHIENYETEFTEVLTTGKYALARMQQLESQLETIQAELTELRKPLRFTGSIDYAVAGNSIIEFYHKAYRYTLDAIAWQETETGYSLTFATARNPIFLTADMLHDKDNREQLAGLTNALSLPTFTPNYQSGLTTLEVQTRKAAKKPQEMPRGVKTADKFPELVSKWKRVRITGGSESGKSPTAENMIICMLLAQGGTVDFYDPMFDSVKNHRSIPAVGKSHADSILGLKDYASRMATAPADKLYLAWFDEIDTTLDENPKSASDLKAVLKQSSHKNSGLVITGQNANVRNLKGNFDRSDMNNFVCVHIGDNYKDAVTNSNLSEAEQSQLMQKGDALKDWCIAQNDKYLLTTEDPEAIRFALVLEPNKKGYYILLPEFGQYTYSQLQQIDSGMLLTTVTASDAVDDAVRCNEQPSNPDDSVAVSLPVSPYVGVACPKCKTGILRRIEKSRGVNYYVCDSCRKKTSEKILQD